MVFEISRINIGSTWQNIAHDVIVGVRPFDSPKTWPFHLSKIFLWLFKQIFKTLDSWKRFDNFSSQFLRN